MCKSGVNKKLTANTCIFSKLAAIFQVAGVSYAFRHNSESTDRITSN